MGTLLFDGSSYGFISLRKSQILENPNSNIKELCPCREARLERECSKMQLVSVLPGIKIEKQQLFNYVKIVFNYCIMTWQATNEITYFYLMNIILLLIHMATSRQNMAQ